METTSSLTFVEFCDVRQGSLAADPLLPPVALIMRRVNTFVEIEGVPDQEIPVADSRMLASSRHLILAWSVFRAILQDRFKEGQTLRSDGFLELPLPDDDPDAFSVLLNVIHGHSRKVPRTVDMHLIAGITILVDKYQLQEVVEAYSDNWIKQIEPDVLEGSTKDLTAWLCTVDTINATRQTAILGAISTLETLISSYTGAKPRCSCSKEVELECDAIVLGALIRGAVKIGLWPLAPSPCIDVFPASKQENSMHEGSDCMRIEAEEK